MVRSCSVMLTMNFRERESSKFCETEKRCFLFAQLHMKLLLSTTALVLILFILGLFCKVYLWDDLSLFGAFLLPVGKKTQGVSKLHLSDLKAAGAGRQKMDVDEKSEVRLVWSSDFLMRCQSAVNSSVVTCKMGGVMTGRHGG